MSVSSDPYRYFRVEARELLDQLATGLLALEQGDGEAELLPQLFRCAHTLKGAARVVQQARMAEMAHALEDVLATYRERGALPPPSDAGELLRLVGSMGDELRGLAPPPSDTSAERSPAATPSPQGETARLELERLDELLDGLSEALVQLGGLREGVATLEQARRLAGSMLQQLSTPAATSASPAERARWLSRTLTTAESLCAALSQAGRLADSGLGRVEEELTQLRDGVHGLRLVPVGGLFQPLELAARDAAAALGKRVEFHAEGGEARLDGHVLAAVRQALVHVVRNAVDHGLEPPAERRALGKPEVGRIHLRVERSGTRVVFSCEDDGRGVDLPGVRRTAVARGLVSETEASGLNEQALLSLLFEAGFSTARAVTEVSGRGVGLDAVRDTVQRLKGEVTASSRPGHGTRISLEVPVSLISVEVLEVEAGEQRVLLPLDALRGTLRLPAGAVSWTGSRATASLAGHVVPFLPLAAALGREAPRARARPRARVVLGAGAAGLVALGADRLHGLSRVVCKPLPPSVPALPLVSGASFDAWGEPLLVLDALGLARLARQGAVVRQAEARAARRPAVLVVDDSITTRMLEQGILEAAGYEVALAASAEEGLERLRQGGFHLLITDVEMPGMSGLELTRVVRAEPAWRELPIIMVSSLATPEDRRRGREAGVTQYIVKGEFDQQGFLALVARLAGGVG